MTFEVDHFFHLVDVVVHERLDGGDACVIHEDIDAQVRVLLRRSIRNCFACSARDRNDRLLKQSTGVSALLNGTRDRVNSCWERMNALCGSSGDALSKPWVLQSTSSKYLPFGDAEVRVGPASCASVTVRTPTAGSQNGLPGKRALLMMLRRIGVRVAVFVFNVGIIAGRRAATRRGGSIDALGRAESSIQRARGVCDHAGGLFPPVVRAESCPG